MKLDVRPMARSEADLIIDYFHEASREHLDLIGVDRALLPDRARWGDLYDRQFAQPEDQRDSLLAIWLLDGEPLGFSTADKIVRGESAHMHLHVFQSDRRRQGLGVRCVVQTAALYFEALRLERLFCEPNAFNTGPNRTLQAAGFKYLRTYETTPGPLNSHQAVTRWVLERS